MVNYIPYDTKNPQEVTGERHTISNGMIRLRHVPLEHSIKISGFTEASSPAALHLNEFACLYSRETGYRESNRIVYFSNAHNAATILVDYFAVGTVVTADDMNEIKAHIDGENAKDALNENEHIQFANEILALQRAVATISAGTGYELPTASATRKGGVKIGNGLEMADDTLNCTVEGDSFFHAVPDFVCFPYVTGGESSWDVDRYEQDFVDYAGRHSKQGDIVNWGNSGSTSGYAVRIGDKWFNLGSDSWAGINPLLSVADRAKLDGLANFTLGTTPLTVEGGMWLSVDGG